MISDSCLDNLLLSRQKPIQQLAVPLPDTLSIPLPNPHHALPLIPSLRNKIFKRQGIGCIFFCSPGGVVGGAERARVAAADVEFVDPVGCAEDVACDLGDRAVVGGPADNVKTPRLGLGIAAICGWSKKRRSAETHRKGLGFKDCAGVVVGDPPSIGCGHNAFCTSIIIETPCSGGNTRDVFREWEVESDFCRGSGNGGG
jgi:hypothetical protein